MPGSGSSRDARNADEPRRHLGASLPNCVWRRRRRISRLTKVCVGALQRAAGAPTALSVAATAVDGNQSAAALASAAAAARWYLTKRSCSHSMGRRLSALMLALSRAVAKQTGFQIQFAFWALGLSIPATLVGGSAGTVSCVLSSTTVSLTPLPPNCDSPCGYSGA